MVAGIRCGDTHTSKGVCCMIYATATKQAIYASAMQVRCAEIGEHTSANGGIRTRYRCEGGNDLNRCIALEAAGW